MRVGRPASLQGGRRRRRQASPPLARSVYESHKWLFNIVVIRVVIWVELSLIVARHAAPAAANSHASACT